MREHMHDNYLDQFSDWPVTEVIRQGTALARGKHKCSRGHEIKPGDYYEYWIGKVDGEFIYDKACKVCDGCEVE